MTPVFQRVVVIGASGQLGTELVSTFSDVGVTGIEHRVLDIEEPDALSAMFARLRPTLVVNAAAYHQIDQCELHPAKAFSVNTIAVDRIAALCELNGAVFAHLSTDYVFDGLKRAPYDEEDEARPLSVYGASKLAGEHLVRRRGAPYFVFRTSGLFGRTGFSNKGPTFVERMLQQAENGQPIRAVDDISFAPSYTVDVAAAIRGVVAAGKYGTYHVTNAGACTWYDLAVEAVRAAGFDAPVAAIKFDAVGYAKRPMYSVLGHGALARGGFGDLPPWQEAVRAYVSGRRSRSPARP